MILPARFFVGLYFVVSAFLGFFVHWKPELDELLTVLIVPVIFSALYYSRLFYVSLTLIAFTVASVVILFSDIHTAPSMQTAVALACCLIVICEIIHSAVGIRKKVERELRKQEHHFRAIIENALDIICTINPDQTIRYVNPPIQRLLGYKPEEIQGTSIYQLLHPEDAEGIESIFQQAIAMKEGPKLLQFRIRHKNDSWRWMEALTANHLHDPNIHGIVVHARDITERKQSQSEKIKLEEELRQAQKLEAIGRLAGGIAHDFNNLLTVITGFSKIALRELGPNHKSSTKIKEVEKAGERGASLIQQLMAFSRKQIFTPTPVNLNSVIDEMQNMLKRLIHEHIELVPILHPQPIMVKADPVQLEQVILNLCINARDAMPDGGKLILETQPISLSREEAAKYADAKEGNYIRLSIIDSGHGMNGETLPHIFEPFFTTKQDGKGTGLGLATTHGIVKQSGGFIHVESESGKGTIFDVYLPVIKDEEMNKQRALNKNNPRGTETVLLVEDNREVRFLVREILKEHGYQVVEASHGKEALKVCKTFHDTIHLLLTDIVLPYKNGFELAKDIIKTHPSIKVLFFTGHAESMLIQNYLEKEDVFLLNKPFTPEELLQALRDVLDSPEQMLLRS